MGGYLLPMLFKASSIPVMPLDVAAAVVPVPLISSVFLRKSRPVLGI